MPVLKVINDAGGSLPMRDTFERVKKYYDQLTPDDIASRLDSGGNRLNNRIQWARQDLVLSEDVERSSSGIWKITEKGKRRLEAGWSFWKPAYYATPANKGTRIQVKHAVEPDHVTDPREALEFARRELVEQVQDEVLERLHSVDPSNFENIIA
ncbi:MAG: winged helix-turn-helix domain-containing protein [Nitrososphaerota archaeon]|nr:winged helix-turn-helix domain-containing protein [Nitrososphaerota archaeon]